jgi:hypothetical protein
MWYYLDITWVLKCQKPLRDLIYYLAKFGRNMGNSVEKYKEELNKKSALYKQKTKNRK